MNKKSILLMVVFLLAMSAFAQKITVKIASVAPARSPWDIEQKAMAAEWLEITNGQVELKFYNSGSMGGESGVIQRMKSLRPGQRSPVDGAIFTNIGLYELTPESYALTLCVPFVFRNQDELSYVLNELNPEIESAVEAEGFQMLGWFNVGWANFFTKEEVRTPDELKALRMGFSGINSPGLMNAFKTANFNMYDVAPEKMMQSIRSSNGVKVVYSIPMFAYAAQYYSVLPYTLDIPLNPIMSAFVISTETWNSIPDQYKPALLESIRRTESKFISVQQESDREYLEKMEEEGNTLIKLSDSEVALWEKTLRGDAEKMAGIQGSVIDGDVYNRIVDLLDEYRSNNGN